MHRSRRPVIGITLDNRDDFPSRYEGSADYATSVERAGGLPLFLPFRTDLSLIPQIVDALDGILFSGGNVPIISWWKVGACLSVVHITIWLGLGTAWWRFLGYW